MVGSVQVLDDGDVPFCESIGCNIRPQSQGRTCCSSDHSRATGIIGLVMRLVVHQGAVTHLEDLFKIKDVDKIKDANKIKDLDILKDLDTIKYQNIIKYQVRIKGQLTNCNIRFDMMN